MNLEAEKRMINGASFATSSQGEEREYLLASDIGEKAEGGESEPLVSVKKEGGSDDVEDRETQKASDEDSLGLDMSYG